MAMSLVLVLGVNSITLGGLLFLLSAGFSLIFGLMKIPNLTHGSFFMLGAYFAVSLMRLGLDFWTAAIASGLGVAVFGVGTPLVEMAVIGASVVSWKIVCASLVPKCRFPEVPQDVGSATAR